MAAGLETGSRGEDLNRRSSDSSGLESWLWEPWAGSRGLCVARPGVSHTDTGPCLISLYIAPSHPVSLWPSFSWPSFSKTSMDIPGRPWALARKSQAGEHCSPHLMWAQRCSKSRRPHPFQTSCTVCGDGVGAKNQQQGR